MPCFDYQDTRLSDVYEIERLRDRNDQLMRAICKIDKVMCFSTAQLDSFGSAVKTLIINHRKLDKKRGK